MSDRTFRYGGDYNPEHWSIETIDQDMALMRKAGVNLVSVGIFGWATAEPAPGQYDFSYYEQVLDRLQDNGIGVSMATMTATPPPWMSHRDPGMLPQLADGSRLSPGARQHYCPSSTTYAAGTVALVTALATALGDHPAIRLWHLNNEYGCHVKACWCDVSAQAFRTWLQRRYGDIEALNRAWSTTFWSQHYSDFAEILPPRLAPTFPNNGQQLDFARFNSVELLGLMRAEIAVLRRISPDVRVTTNFAAVMPALDLWEWTKDLDVVSFDSYPDPADPQAYLAAGFDYDVIRSLRGGRPWLLMEQAPSAVNWRRRNAPKPAGRMRLGSWQAVAHGADAVMFFQWRASPGGAEKFHSGMVGHTGPDSRVFREVSALGAELAEHSESFGVESRSETALLLDWDSWWAGELDSHPTGDLHLRDQLLDWYRVLSAAAVPTDVLPPTGELADYRLLIAPSWYLVTEAAAGRLSDWVRAGGVLVLNYFCGVVDAFDRIHPGGAPGPLRELVGGTVQEWWPLSDGEQLTVRIGDIVSTATVFAEDLLPHGAETIGSFEDGELAGGPAVLRHRVGAGTVYYLGARLDDSGTGAVLAAAIRDAGVTPLATDLPIGVEAIRRGAGDDAVLYLLNHTTAEVTVQLDRPMTDLLTGGAAASTVALGRYGVALLR